MINEIKIFRIEGSIIKKNFVMPFLKDIRALKKEDAIEKIYADFGSQHRARRYNVKISSVKEISIEETKDPIIREMNGE